MGRQLRITSIYVLLAIATLCSRGIAQPSFYEDFSSTTFADTAATTANWDTVAAQLKHHDFTSTARGSLNTPQSAMAIEFFGSYAYVADGLGGLLVIDCTDPDLPVQIGSYDTEGSASDVEVSGNIAFVAGATSGLQKLIITNQNPSLSSTFDTPGTCNGVFLEGNLAYVTDGPYGLQIIDVSPLSPMSLVANYDTPGTAYEVFVDGNLAYVADGATGLLILDVTDPAAPALLSTHNTAAAAAAVTVAGDHAYVADASNGLVVVDVSNPAAPFEVGHLDTPGTAFSVAVSGDHAFVADYTSGVQVIDISDPTAPALEESLPGPIVRNVDLNGNYLGMASEGAGIYLFEIAQRVGPLALDNLGMSMSAESVQVRGDLAYLTDDLGLQVYDVTDPHNPLVLGSVALPFLGQDIDVEGDHVYVANHDSSLVVVDVSDASLPTIAGSLAVNGSARGIDVRGDLAYVAVADSTLVVVDVTDPTVPAQLGSVNLGGVPRGVAVDGEFTFVTVAGAGMWIVTVADPLTPLTTGFFPHVSVNDVCVAGNHAYLSDSAGTLQVVDITGISSPVLAGTATIGAPGQPVGIDIFGDRVFVAGRTGGVTEVDVSDPTAPSVIGNVDLGADARSVHVVGDHAYVAADTRGLQVLQVSQREVDLVSDFAQSLEIEPGLGGIVRTRLSAVEFGDVFWSLRVGTGPAYLLVPLYNDGSWYDTIGPYSNVVWRAWLTWAPGAAPIVDDFRIDYLYEFPWIDSVSDIPGDQGRQVRVEWTRSGYDFSDADDQIVEYAVYRRIDPAATAAKVRGGPSPLLADASPAAQADAAAKLAASWDFLTTVPVRLEDHYAVVVPTLADSTIAGGQRFSTFMVSALTATPGVFFDSPADSGYSVDNLAPGVPAAIAAAYSAEAVALDWEDAPEADFAYYRVYRGTDPDFVPSESNVVQEVAASAWSDPGPDPWDHHYKVSAVDHAGNEGEPGSVSEVSGVGDRVPTAVFALHGAVPNPFNPSTKIAYAVPADGRVQLEIYDVGGRRVRTLVDQVLPAGPHTVIWDGLDAHGRQSPSGVYLYRLRAGNRTASGRMVLVK